jgi:hypothetical protein
MSQQGPIREPPPQEDRKIDSAETSSDAEAGELSFDDLPFAGRARDGKAPFVHKLQERAEGAIHAPADQNATHKNTAQKNTADSGEEAIERWSPRVQMLCIMGGRALCWAVILMPFLLF